MSGVIHGRLLEGEASADTGPMPSSSSSSSFGLDESKDPEVAIVWAEIRGALVR